jgi:hypothetical protein
LISCQMVNSDFENCCKETWYYRNRAYWQ